MSDLQSTMSDLAGPRTTQRRPQFSLRTLLLLFGVVAIGLSLWVSFRQSQEMAALRKENARMRDELGELLIEPGTEHQLQAIALRSNVAKAWRWRVYVPPGRQCVFRSVIGHIPADGNATGSGGTLSLDAGQHVILARLWDDGNGRWTWLVRREGEKATGQTEVSASRTLNKLLADSKYITDSSGVERKVQRADPAAGIELFRCRWFAMVPDPSGNSWSSPPTSGASDGILLNFGEKQPGE